MSSSLSFTGYSTALFSSWYFVDEIGCLFDCGDGVSSGLLQKSRKVKHVFISHADRDHLAGLLQFLQLNGRPELTVHYPADCGSFPALAGFAAKFDPQTSGTRWNPLASGDEVSVRSDLVVRAVENGHVRVTENQSKSLSYVVESVSRKLKSELLGKSGDELAALKKSQGPDSIVDQVRRPRLAYSGDTPVEFDQRYAEVDILIHEATFLTESELPGSDSHRNRHSSLDQVIRMVAQCPVGKLVLGHFSSRYDEETIRQSVEALCDEHELSIPIELVLPGRMWRSVINLRRVKSKDG